jgi:hypothetical protein
MKKTPSGESVPKWIAANIPDELVDSSLFRFDITLQVPDPDDPSKKKQITVDVLHDIDIDMDILEEQMQDIPAQYMFWSSVYSELRLAVSVAERNLKVRRGKATKFTTEEAKREGTRISVEQVKLIVEQDEKLCRCDLALARAHMLAGKVYHLVRALEMKQENCRSLIGLKKAEYEKS